MKKAVFLDRDGVINEVLSDRVKFVNKPNQLFLLEGVGEAIKQLNEKKIPVFVVTNQGGVGLGYMKKTALEDVHKKMKHELNKYGATITDIAYCPHKPHAGCECRKPEAQMLMDLAKKHNVDLATSIMVGDREPDIQAGKKAGCKTVYISSSNENHFYADAVFPNLYCSIPWIFEQLL